ncbi:hypothetical protein V8E53_000183 [Lactarius tabidus]
MYWGVLDFAFTPQPISRTGEQTGSGYSSTVETTKPPIPMPLPSTHHHPLHLNIRASPFLSTFNRNKPQHSMPPVTGEEKREGHRNAFLCLLVIEKTVENDHPLPPYPPDHFTSQKRGQSDLKFRLMQKALSHGLCKCMTTDGKAFALSALTQERLYMVNLSSQRAQFHRDRSLSEYNSEAVAHGCIDTLKFKIKHRPSAHTCMAAFGQATVPAITLKPGNPNPAGATEKKTENSVALPMPDSNSNTPVSSCDEPERPPDNATCSTPTGHVAAPVLRTQQRALDAHARHTSDGV